MKIGAVIVDVGPVDYGDLVARAHRQIYQSAQRTCSEYVRGRVVGSGNAIAGITRLYGVAAAALCDGDCKISTSMSAKSQDAYAWRRGGRPK